MTQTNILRHLVQTYSSQTLMAPTHLASHLVAMEILQTFLLLLLLPHADPCVCDDGVSTVHCLQRVIGDGELGAVL